MGQAITIALAQEGCNVIFTYNSHEVGADETLKQTGKNGTKFRVDMSSEDEIQKLFDFVQDKFGRLDILVNNAGINKTGDFFDTKYWREIFQVDLFSVVSCTGAAVKLMKDGGKILNITSIYADGKACWKGLPAYGAAKAGVNNFTQSMAKNLAPKILINAIAPGYVKTPLWGERTEHEFIENGNEQLIERMIMPDEVAQMAVAIIKNDAMTGEIVVIDGGLSLKTV